MRKMVGVEELVKHGVIWSSICVQGGNVAAAEVWGTLHPSLLDVALVQNRAIHTELWEIFG